MIKRISRKNLDLEKYSTCLANTINYRIYAEYWYLDTLVGENWACYVWNDYEAIMPICYAKKLGIKYIIQPIYCQQLGVFHSENFSKEIFHRFEKKLHRNLVRSYHFNEENTEMFSPKGNKKINQVLDISKSYDETFTNYSRNRRNEVRKAKKSNYKLVKVEKLDNFFRINSDYDYLKKDELEEKLTQSIINLVGLNIINIFEIYTEDKILLGCQLEMISNNRIYNFAFARNQSEKNQLCSAYIIDFLIEKSSDKNLLFDFEGSMVTSINQFFKGFGTEEKRYTNYSNFSF